MHSGASVRRKRGVQWCHVPGVGGKYPRLVTSNESSSYATGGGGVSLEHQYAATLLAALLVGRPTTELGDAVEVTAIRLQAADVSPVDDVVLEGLGSNGSLVRASV